ncbi:MAG TPA: hypothetical protein VI727_04090 [Candidatus Brocadiaceae bacterium]|nr:hypothetical protein [Candidatus Brocadiaceae bacterium]
MMDIDFDKLEKAIEKANAIEAVKKKREEEIKKFAEKARRKLNR